MEGKQPRRRPRTRWTDRIGKNEGTREENWEETQSNGKWENRDGWGFLIIAHPYIWKRLENYEFISMFINRLLAELKTSLMSMRPWASAKKALW